MRRQSTFITNVFRAAVAVALGFGVSSAYAATTPPAKIAGCPAYTPTYDDCNNCCAEVYGGFGAWSPSTQRCICGF